MEEYAEKEVKMKNVKEALKNYDIAIKVCESIVTKNVKGQQRLKAVMLADKAMVQLDSGQKSQAAKNLTDSVKINSDYVNKLFIQRQKDNDAHTARNEYTEALAGYQKSLFLAQYLNVQGYFLDLF